MAQKPRFWRVTATARTQDPATGEYGKHRFEFDTKTRCKLSDISELVNETIHESDDFLPDCVSVMVVARIML